MTAKKIYRLIRCGDVITVCGGVWHGYRAVYLYRNGPGLTMKETSTVWLNGRELTVPKIRLSPHPEDETFIATDVRPA